MQLRLEERPSNEHNNKDIFQSQSYYNYSNNFEMNSRLDKTYHPESINENSNNLYLDPNQVNSISRYNFMREQSINFRACLSGDYSRHIGQEQLDNPDAGNTINFWQANRRNLFNIQTKMEKEEGQLFQQQENLHQQIKQVDPSKKKGLKYLSFILNRLLRKQKFDNNQIVNQCIDNVLPKPPYIANQCIGNVLPKSPQIEKYQKQSQNIRRRIYDAINVMSAIGLVVRNGPSQIYIRKNQNRTNFCYQPAKAMNRFKFIQSNTDNNQSFKKLIKDKVMILKDKMDHLQKMKQTLNLLKNHMERNKKINQQQRLIDKKSQIKHQNDQHCQNEIKKEEEANNKIFFPILMIGTKQQEITIKCIGKNRQKINIKYMNQLKLVSQLYSLNYLYHKQQINPHDMIQMKQELHHKQIQKQKQIQNANNRENYEQFVVSCFQSQQKPQVIELDKQESPEQSYLQRRQKFICIQDQEQFSPIKQTKSRLDSQQENVKINSIPIKESQIDKKIEKKSNIFMNTNFITKLKDKQSKRQIMVINVEEDDQNSNKIL